MPTIAYHTLGCKVNQYETEKIREALEIAGFETVPFGSRADAYLINTCTVTGVADSKSRAAVRKALRLNPEAHVVVAGCYAELEPGRIQAIEGIDLIVPNDDKHTIPERVSAHFSTMLRGENQPRSIVEGNSQLVRPRLRTRAVVKVQDGCDQFCSYCIVPYARARKWSRPMPEVLAEIEALAEFGYREIVLTGIRLGSYGDRGQRSEVGSPNPKRAEVGLSDLILAAAEVSGVERVRVSSVEQWEIDEAVLDAVQHPRVCRHLHIPLQSGDDDVLRRMNRPYTGGQFLDLVRRIRSVVPGIAITTDVMVGFPGESDKAFENTCRLIEEAAFSKLHVFRYSPRKRTAAASLPDQIDEETKKLRAAILAEMGKRAVRRFAESFMGETLEVLAEGRCFDKLSMTGMRPGMLRGEKQPRSIPGGIAGVLAGFADNYVEVRFEGDQSLVGEIVRVRITGVDQDGTAVGQVLGIGCQVLGRPSAQHPIGKEVEGLSDCIFCKIANKEVGKLVYEDESVAAFDDLNPQAPVHVLIVPKKHIARLSDVTEGEEARLLGHILCVANKIASDRGIAEGGYRVVVNCNEGAGQSVWHVHFHLLGGRKMHWPPG